jgi:hypothetical protein
VTYGNVLFVYIYIYIYISYIYIQYLTNPTIKQPSGATQSHALITRKNYQDYHNHLCLLGEDDDDDDDVQVVVVVVVIVLCEQRR